MALRKLSNADDDCEANWRVELTDGPCSTDAPVAATTFLGSGGSIREPLLAAPASMTGTAAGVPAIRLCSRGLVSSASRVDSPSILIACKPCASVGTTARPDSLMKLLTGTLRAAAADR